MTAELLEEGLAVVSEASERSLVVRLLGGAGVVLHCRSILEGGLHRPIGDLDAATTRRDAKAVAALLRGQGYVPETRFNALHGERRMIFHGPLGKLDLFVDVFEMCHRIELASRFELDAPTVTASDLLLTKLQVVELNAKDARDAALILEEHELARGAGDWIDIEYLSSLAGDDWGLWRTATQTLERLAELEPGVADRASALRLALDQAPKTRRFRLRARVGERKRWYEIPDEVG
ncbi:MAG: hypothetical protein ACRDNG_12985 [Gaiellaceae bacterium]